MTSFARSPRAALISYVAGVLALAAFGFDVPALRGSFVSPAAAHSGHDHGPPSPALAVSARPRMAVETELYQLVAILTAPQQLTIFLDRTDSNAPVTDARVGLLQGDTAIAAEPRQDGSYTLRLPDLEKPGQHALIFRIEAPAGEDLIAGELQVPLLPPSATTSA